MYVPSDSFGGQSPEKTAASQLRNLFTFVAVKVVKAQLEGAGRGALGSYNAEQYNDLQKQLQEVPFKDGDEWIRSLMRRNSALALRVMEVRDAYCNEDFEWDSLQRVAQRDMKDANARLMRQFVTAALEAGVTEHPPIDTQAAGGRPSPEAGDGNISSSSSSSSGGSPPLGDSGGGAAEA